MYDNNPTSQQLKETARIMGHTVATQLTTYTKHSTVLHPQQQQQPPPEQTETPTITQLQEQLEAKDQRIAELEAIVKKLTGL